MCVCVCVECASTHTFFYVAHIIMHDVSMHALGKIATATCFSPTNVEKKKHQSIAFVLTNALTVLTIYS